MLVTLRSPCHGPQGAPKERGAPLFTSVTYALRSFKALVLLCYLRSAFIATILPMYQSAPKSTRLPYASRALSILADPSVWDVEASRD